MRQHGPIRENRRGLAAILGLLGGIIAGAVLMAPAQDGDASGRASQHRTVPGGR